MKKILQSMLFLAVTIAFVTTTACKKEKNNVVLGGNTANTVLSEIEKQNLIFTREEEKLARDVYVVLVNKWPSLSFLNNIISSEQTHMDAIKSQLDNYTLADPITDNTTGVFQNVDLRNLYAYLTKIGNTSEVDALIVGMTIEDMDI